MATDRELLQPVGERCLHAGTREQATRNRFDLEAKPFWLQVNRSVQDPSPDIAVEFAPTTGRSRHLQAAGMQQRTSRGAG